MAKTPRQTAETQEMTMAENQRQQGQDNPGSGGQGTGKPAEPRRNPEQMTPNDPRNREQEQERFKHDQGQKQGQGNQGGQRQN
jgi:hypothetical protein